MKKTTLIFLTSFFFFVGITTTKAYGEEVSPMLDLNSWNVSFDIPNETNLNLARNWVSNYCNNYNHYVISTQTFYETIGSDEIKDKEPIYVYCFNDNLSLSITSQYYGNNSNIKYLDIGSSNTNGIIKYFYDNGLEYYSENNKTGPFSYIRYVLRNLSEIKFPYVESNIEDIGVFSNNPVLSRGYRAYNSIKYNDLIYNANDKFIDFENNIFASPDNIFHETLYTTDYNSIEFEFDLASLPLYSEGNTFNLYFEFKSVTQSGEDETIKFSLPYYTLTQLVDSTTEEGASITLTKEDIEKYFKQDNYTYTYSNSEQIRYLNDLGVLEKNYTKYKITLPLEFSYASFVDLYVKSNLDFEVIRNYSSSYDESVVSDIETIDLTNKYGVVFIPLVKNGSIHFPFKSVGHFFVQHRDSYNEDFNILSTTTVGYCDEYHKNDENYTCADLSGLYSFTFKEGFDNQVLTFINRNYENDTNSFVEYHSNSFNYCVLDTPTSTCNIINPNTDEEVNLTLKDFFDYKTESNNESFFEMFSNAFNRFKTAILSIFDYISIYFESLPSILKDFYIVIFVFVILAVIVKFLI